MGGPIVGPLTVVLVAGGIFRGVSLEIRVKVNLNRRISILLNKQGCRRVADEKRQQALDNSRGRHPIRTQSADESVTS